MQHSYCMQSSKPRHVCNNYLITKCQWDSTCDLHVTACMLQHACNMIATCMLFDTGKHMGPRIWDPGTWDLRIWDPGTCSHLIILGILCISQLVLGTSVVANPPVMMLCIMLSIRMPQYICRPLTCWAISILVYCFTSLQKLWISNLRFNSKFTFVNFCVNVCYSIIQAVPLPVVFNFCSEVK